MNKRIQVLVIEDEKPMRQAFEALALTPQNQDILIAAAVESEAEALELLGTQHFDVAVVDMRIPRVPGGHRDNEAGLRLIKATVGRAGAPRFLAISGVLEEPDFILRARDIGAAGYFLKQSEGWSELFDAIRKVHQGRKVYPPEIVDWVLDETFRRPKLTEREQEIWKLISDGLQNAEIAHELSISVDAVKRNTTELYSKIGVTNRAEAVRLWMEKQYGM